MKVLFVIISDLCYSLVVVVLFLCLWECDRMLHWIGPAPWKRSPCLQDRSCSYNMP